MEDSLHRETGISTFNACWEILDNPGRPNSENLKLLELAFVSRWHWSFVAGPTESAISDWMVGRAASECNLHDLAIHFAQSAYELSLEGPDWLRASGAEGLARVHLRAGSESESVTWTRHARELVDQIIDPAEKAQIDAQLREIEITIPKGIET
jgi:hypothetical protein